MQKTYNGLSLPQGGEVIQYATENTIFLTIRSSLSSKATDGARHLARLAAGFRRRGGESLWREEVGEMV